MSEDPGLVSVPEMPFAFTLKPAGGGPAEGFLQATCTALPALTDTSSYIVSTAAELRCSVTPSCGCGIAGRTASVHPEPTSDNSFVKIISFDFSMMITEMETTRVCPWPLHWSRLPGLPVVSVT